MRLPILQLQPIRGIRQEALLDQPPTHRTSGQTDKLTTTLAGDVPTGCHLTRMAGYSNLRVGGTGMTYIRNCAGIGEAQVGKLSRGGT